MKKNTASLVLAIIGAILGLIGGIMWAACADTLAAVTGDKNSTLYMVLFILFGIGGAVLSLIGGIQSYGYKKGGLLLSALGLALQVANLIVTCVYAGGFSFVMELCTMVSVILLIVQTVMAARKPQN